MGVILDIDNRHIRIRGASRKIMRTLERVTSYKVAGHQFSPAFRNKRWDGREHLLKYSDKHGYRAPIGLVEDIIGVLDEMGVEYDLDTHRRRAPGVCIEFGWNPEIELRPYQNDAINSVINVKKLFRGLGILKLPIRSGKTWTAAGLIRRLGARTLFIVPSQMLLHQTRKALKKVLCTEVGIIGDSEWEEADITVATIQTLARARGGTKEKDGKKHKVPMNPRYKAMRTAYDLVIFDECFVAGTMVGNKRIENIHLGDFVPSFDPKTMKSCHKRVTRLFRKTPISLVRVTTESGICFICTPNHPVQTQRGFILAGRLCVGSDILYSTTSEENDEMHSVRNRNQRQIELEQKKPVVENREGVLLQGLRKESNRSENCVKSPSAFQGHEEDIQRSDEGKQSDVECTNEGQNVSKPEGTKSHTRMVEGREWKAHTHSSEDVTPGVRGGLASGACDQNLDRERKWQETRSNTAQLQGGYSELRFENCNRSGRNFTSQSEIESVGCQKRFCFVESRVASVKILEPGCDGTYGGLCPNGVVYNLEVEDTNTYIANGMAVHNCHHLRGDVWHKAMMDFDAPFRIGLSATAYLENERENERGVIWLKACCGGIRIDIPTSQLIEDGYLMRQHIELYVINEPEDLRDRKWSQSLLNEAIYENEARNLKVIEVACEKVAAGLRVMIISNRHNQINLLMACADEMTGLSVASVTGPDSTASRENKMQMFVDGDINVLIGTVFGEGVDIPEVECVINAEGGRDVKAAVQRMRNLTPAEGKTEAVFVDFMDMTNSYFAEHSQERLATYRSEPAFVIRRMD